MGLYNRLTRQSEPSDWQANHDKGANPNMNVDWYRWHIAVHPFTDMIRLYIDGDLGSGQTAQDRLQELFDLSQTELDQLMEVWNNFIDTAGGDASVQRNNVERLQAVLRAIERGIPQMYVSNTHDWLYNKLGITIADDR